ncbi:hypothetical protein SDC9_124709 [bioreactor metagenome]|uniref:Uncharacterized protein n=1 Tax=bioreactor metagenome TaxID=1076179 RepID=A0A645CL66_9ZZZZ
MVETRCTCCPTRSGLSVSQRSRPPAHMRRGSGTGGRKPPRRGCPSGPISLWRACGRKYSQCHNAGTAEPSPGTGSSRSSVAERARSGAAVMMSSAVSLRSCQDWSLVRAAASIWTVFGFMDESEEGIQFTVAPEVFTICAHLAMSCLRTAASSSGVT